MFLQKRFFFNGSSLSGGHTIDSEIKTEQSSAVVKSKSILTTLSNYNSLQKLPPSLSNVGALDEKSRLKEIKAQSSDKLILGHLNIRSIRNKFEALKFIIYHNIYIFLISETKLEGSKGGGLLLYIREDIPSNILT